MSLRNLLVNLDGTRACDKRVQAALALAHAHDAHLTGLYCVPEFPQNVWPHFLVHKAAEQREMEEQRARDALERFATAAAGAGVLYDTRTVHSPFDEIGEEVATHARYADMVIVGQVDPDDPPRGGEHLIEEVALRAGRPVLVIPYIGPPTTRTGETAFGRTVTVAWDAGREAARAVHDALPLLERADHADIVCINPAKHGGRHGDDPGADIALHLSRHGIDVTAHALEAQDIDPGSLLLSNIADRGSDMLVMGAWAHSRMREWVLGGVTRSVVEQMTVPVLMSH